MKAWTDTIASAASAFTPWNLDVTVEELVGWHLISLDSLPPSQSECAKQVLHGPPNLADESTESVIVSALNSKRFMRFCNQRLASVAPHPMHSSHFPSPSSTCSKTSKVQVTNRPHPKNFVNQQALYRQPQSWNSNIDCNEEVSNQQCAR